MHNQRNRLSADMKGTVAVETATKGKDGREDVGSLQEGKQNDTPKLDASNIKHTDENNENLHQDSVNKMNIKLMVFFFKLQRIT